MKVLKSQRGQGLIEYIIIVSLVAVASMASMRHLQKHLNIKLAQISDVLQGKKPRDNSKEKLKKVHTSKKDLSNFFEGAATEDKK